MPAGDISPTTPDYSWLQNHLGPYYLDADYARLSHNARGQGVKIIDVEYSWDLNHEDLSDVSLVWGTPYPSGADKNHGTAVLGLLAAQDNGYGMIGIAPDATVGVAAAKYQIGNVTVYLHANAINEAATQLGPGDVILIELQIGGPDSHLDCNCYACDTFEAVPAEWDPATFDAIRWATANRIIVVEAAGNGGMNLDDPRYQGRFDRAVRDSGAIVVGAALAFSPLCFTNYGSRVDLQGEGFSVATLGYGHWAKVNGSDRRQFYTASFGGTSSASAMVAGAVAVAQSAVADRGVRLFPSEMLSLLARTGWPQRGAEHIGPMPNLRAVIDAYEIGDTCQPITPSEVADTRSGYIPPFGDLEYCFTVDMLDAARAVKYVFDTCTGTTFDTILEVMYDPQSRIPVAYNDDGCKIGSRQSRVAVQPTTAGTYVVRVRGGLGASGDMTLRFFKLPPPIQTSGE